MRTPRLAEETYSRKSARQVQRGFDLIYLLIVLSNKYLWKSKLGSQLWLISHQCDWKGWNICACLECVVASQFLLGFQTPSWPQLPRQVTHLSVKWFFGPLHHQRTGQYKSRSSLLIFRFLWLEKGAGDLFMHKKKCFWNRTYDRKRSSLFKSSCRVRNLIA